MHLEKIKYHIDILQLFSLGSGLGLAKEGGELESLSDGAKAVSVCIKLDISHEYSR